MLVAKKSVERFTEARGAKKQHLIEEALLHHPKALRERLADIIIPARVVVNEETANALERADNPRDPTGAMKELFSEK